MTLQEITEDFAAGLLAADGKKPRAGRYFPGIGPHHETDVVALVLAEMLAHKPAAYSGALAEAAYPDGLRRCDLCLGPGDTWEWAIEIKASRALRNNGNAEPAHLKQLLSPYESDRSLVTDCVKVTDFAPARHHAVLMYGYDYAAFPLSEMVGAVRSGLKLRCNVLEEASAPFDGLVHPHHQRGVVYGWRVTNA